MPFFGCETDAVDFFLNHPGMYVAPSSQPTEAGNDGNWKDLLKRTAVLAHLVESMHDGRAHLDATCGADPFDACAKSLGRIDKAHREFLECNPARLMTQLPCPGGPVVDFIFAGDSSMALVDETVDSEGKTTRVKRNVGEYLKEAGPSLLTDRAGSVQYSLHWGRGLEAIIDGIEACLDNGRRRTPGGAAPAVIVVSYAGNDVYGNHGFVGNPWVDTNVLHRNPAKQRAAYEWQAELAQKHAQQMRRLADLRQRKDVAALIVICYCDSQSYGLPEEYARQMCQSADVFTRLGVTNVTGTTLVRSCQRYDNFHCHNTEENRAMFVKYYANVALFAYHYWVLAGVDVLRKDANLFAKPRGEKTHRQHMLEHIWKRRIDSGYLFLGDFDEHDELLPGQKRQTAIDQKNGWLLTVSETTEVAHMDDAGDPVYATKEQIEAAKLLPFNQRLYNMPRGTVGPDFYDEGQDVQVPAEPSEADQTMPDASVPEVIEIDDTFAPSADSPPGTEGRDANNQAPVSTPGMEFVSVTADMPKHGDTEVDPVTITEEEELHVSNEPIADENYVNELLKDHLDSAIRQGFENKDQPDDDSDEEIVFKEPILTSMHADSCQVAGVTYQLRKKEDESDVIRIYMAEEDIPQLTGEALRKFREVTTLGNEPDLANKAPQPRIPKAKASGEPGAPKAPHETAKSKTKPASPKAKARPAGAEADVEMKPTEETQPKVPKRPAGAVASDSTPTAKPAVKAKAMPRAPPVPPVSSPLGENEVVALQSRSVPGAANLANLNSKQVWISRRVSGLLRGWEHSRQSWHKVQPPSFDAGLWMDFGKVYSFIKRKYDVNLTNDELLTVITSNHRFMLEVRIAPKGTLVGGKYQYTPLRIKAIQNHNEWSNNNVKDALPEHERFVTLDEEYTSVEYLAGKFPRVPRGALGKVKEVAPTILYHYTHRAALVEIINMGLIPGGNRTGARFTFLTKEDPWTISGTDYAAMAATRPICVALDLQMMILNGHRLIETTAGTILCPDWLANRNVIYVYDMESRCYAFANHVYAHYRGIITGETKAFNSARTGGPVADDDEMVKSPLEKYTYQVLGDYERWCGKVDTFSPFVYGELFERPGVKDQMISGKQNPDLETYEVTYVVRRPNFNAYRNQVSPKEMLPNYNRPRFDWRKIHPETEGFGNTRWMVVEGIQMPEAQCPTCTNTYTHGMMSCITCGTFLNNASDLCKAAQLIRIEEIAADLGIEVTMDMVPEDRLQGTGVRRTPAGTPGHEVQRASRSGINILKANAKSHVQKADKMSMTVSQRQLVDAFYAFNCAAQDLSPICIQFLERLSDAIIPDPPRTREMIARGIGHRYAGKVIFMNEPAKGNDADLSEDFFIYWKNRLHRPETFAADYCQGAKRPAILGFGGEWRSEKTDPDDVLDELLEFVMGDAQFVPGLDINLVKETRALVIPKAKAAPGPGESLARATRTQAETSEQRWRGAAGSDQYHDWQQSSSSSSWWSSSNRNWWQDDRGRGSDWRGHDWWSQRRW